MEESGVAGWGEMTPFISNKTDLMVGWPPKRPSEMALISNGGCNVAILGVEHAIC